MDPIVVLCPGQGAQFLGMGKAWFDASPDARRTFEEADAALMDFLGEPLSSLCFEGPAERLNRTDVSQPAIFVTSVASWRGLAARWGPEEAGVPITMAAGLSLGEFTALHLADALSFADGLKLVTLRGRAMQEASEAVQGGMVALIGADEAQAEGVVERARGGDVLVCANFNAPGQVVLSGHIAAIERATTEADKSGLRTAILPVAGAFHSPLMAPAARQLAEALARTEIRRPQCPVVSNVSALPHEYGETGTIAGNGGSVRQLLVEQLTSPVRWAESCRWILNRPPALGGIHEVAPGATLAGLMRRISPKSNPAKVISHDQP